MVSVSWMLKRDQGKWIELELALASYSCDDRIEVALQSVKSTVR